MAHHTVVIDYWKFTSDQSVIFLHLTIWVLVSFNNRIKMAVKTTLFFLLVIMSLVAVMAMQPVYSGGKYYNKLITEK